MSKAGTLKLASGWTWKKSLCASALALVASNALAGGYSSAVTITSIEAIDTQALEPRVFLVFSSLPHTTGCALNLSGYWRLGGDADHQKTVLAIAMAARLSDRQVKVFFDDSYSLNHSCDGTGTAGYPVVLGLQML